jgi:hypothetical protein
MTTNSANQVNQTDEVLLQPSWRKWLGVMVIGLLFVASGVFTILNDGGFMAWSTVLFFGACALVAIFQLFGNSYLRLHEHGFEQKIMWRKTNFEWNEVSDFRTSWIGIVCFDHVHDEGKFMTKINRKLSAGSSALGDTFGMSATELAKLMNSFREKSAANEKLENTNS